MRCERVGRGFWRPSLSVVDLVVHLTESILVYLDEGGLEEGGRGSGRQIRYKGFITRE